MLGNYLQQTTSADVIFQMHFLGTLRVNWLSGFFSSYWVVSVLNVVNAAILLGSIQYHRWTVDVFGQ